MSAQPTAARVLRPRANWEWEASCRGMDVVLFFGSRESPLTRSAGTEGQRVCLGCVVRRDCLLSSLLTREPTGMYGGFLPHERKAMLSSRAGDATLVMADFDAGILGDGRRP